MLYHCWSLVLAFHYVRAILLYGKVLLQDYLAYRQQVDIMEQVPPHHTLLIQHQRQHLLPDHQAHRQLQENVAVATALATARLAMEAERFTTGDRPA